uniref:MYND-type domain-containing protein n=1 Tax=Glossina pallidipes TaxID=7398 RepID=A0A1B0AGK8_GLOPL
MKIGKGNKDIINGLSCNVCREIAHHKCERCLDPCCSAECQMADWPKHKWNCYKMPNLIKINTINGKANGNSNLNDYYLKTDAVSIHNVEVAAATGPCFKLEIILKDENLVALAEPLNGKCPNGTFPRIVKKHISTPIEDNKAIAGLQSCIENATDFDVIYDDVKNVDLLFRTKQRQSLCLTLLPMLFEARLSPDKVLSKKTKITSIVADTCHHAENMSSPPSPPYSPDIFRKEMEELEIKNNERASISNPNHLVNNNTNKIYTLDDLEVIPIECGDNVDFYILTCNSGLNENPYVAAFDCSKKEFFSEMNNYLTMVADYCEGSDSPPGGYKPKIRSNEEAIAFVKNIVDHPVVLAKVDNIDGTYRAKLHDLENLCMLPSNEN